MNILRYVALKKNILDFSFTFFFSTMKNKSSRSRRSAWGVKEKCVRGQGEARWGSRRSASGVKEKCIRGQGEVLPLNVWYSAEALIFDPWCTFHWPPAHFSLTPGALLLDPWCTSPWPMTHFSLTWRAYSSKLKKQKNCKRKIQNYFWKHYIS